MATVHATLSRVDDRGDTGGSLPLITSVPESAQTITSSGTSARSTIAAAQDNGLVWTVTADGPVFVKFGATAVAAPNSGHLILTGQVRDFTVTAAGEKIAVVDA